MSKVSILIKGMEMPKSCRQCRFFEWSREVWQRCAAAPDINFRATIDWMDVDYERHGDCPLVEFPPREQSCRTCVQDCQFIGCYMPNIVGCSGYIPAEKDTDFYTKGHLHLGYAEEGEG